MDRKTIFLFAFMLLAYIASFSSMSMLSPFYPLEVSKLSNYFTVFIVKPTGPIFAKVVVKHKSVIYI